MVSQKKARARQWVCDGLSGVSHLQLCFFSSSLFSQHLSLLCQSKPGRTHAPELSVGLKPGSFPLRSLNFKHEKCHCLSTEFLSFLRLLTGRSGQDFLRNKQKLLIRLHARIGSDTTLLDWQGLMMVYITQASFRVYSLSWHLKALVFYSKPQRIDQAWHLRNNCTMTSEPLFRFGQCLLCGLGFRTRLCLAVQFRYK